LGQFWWIYHPASTPQTGWSKTTAPWLYGNPMVNLISLYLGNYMWYYLLSVIQSLYFTSIYCVYSIIYLAISSTGQELFFSQWYTGFFLELCYCY